MMPTVEFQPNVPVGSCIEYAKKYNGAVSNDDVRALAITIYIQHTKGPRA